MDAPKSVIQNVGDVVASVKKGIARKTGFELTDAVCPINETDLRVGFQRAIYFDKEFGRIQVVVISQTKELLFGLFTDLIEELLRVRRIKKCGVNAVFESRHIPDKKTGGKKYFASGTSKYYRNYISREIDPITFLSMLYDFEELLTNDGFTGISLTSDPAFSELRFDVHKIILFFSKHQRLIEKIASFLHRSGVPQFEEISTVAENPHIHIGDSGFNGRFRQLVTLSGAKRIA